MGIIIDFFQTDSESWSFWKSIRSFGWVGIFWESVRNFGWVKNIKNFGWVENLGGPGFGDLAPYITTNVSHYPSSSSQLALIHIICRVNYEILG